MSAQIALAAMRYVYGLDQPSRLMTTCDAPVCDRPTLLCSTPRRSRHGSGDRRRSVRGLQLRAAIPDQPLLAAVEESIQRSVAPHVLRVDVRAPVVFLSCVSLCAAFHDPMSGCWLPQCCCCCFLRILINLRCYVWCSALRSVSARVPAVLQPQQPHFGTRAAKGFLEHAAAALRDAAPAAVRDDLSGAEAAGRQGDHLVDLWVTLLLQRAEACCCSLAFVLCVVLAAEVDLQGRVAYAAASASDAVQRTATAAQQAVTGKLMVLSRRLMARGCPCHVAPVHQHAADCKGLLQSRALALEVGKLRHVLHTRNLTPPLSLSGPVR